MHHYHKLEKLSFSVIQVQIHHRNFRLSQAFQTLYQDLRRRFFYSGLDNY